MKSNIVFALSLLLFGISFISAQQSCYEQYLRAHNMPLPTDSMTVDDSYDKLKKEVIARQLMPLRCLIGRSVPPSFSSTRRSSMSDGIRPKKRNGRAAGNDMVCSADGAFRPSGTRTVYRSRKRGDISLDVRKAVASLD